MPTIIGGTTGVAPAQWTTAGRPSSPLVGQLGWNTTLSQLEAWNGFSWASIVSASYFISYLMIAGGGGGSWGRGGGGGAGGLITATGVSVNAGAAFPIVIGAGGSGGTSGVNPTVGVNTTFNSLTAVGGGQAGQANGATGAGGSGGGANGQNSVFVAGGAGTGGQGFAGAWLYPR